MSEPAWLAKAREYVGFHEQPGNRGIEEFIGGAKTGRVGDAWCAIFANFCLERAGIRGTRSALARSFERDPNFERLTVPRPGCIVTFWRNSPTGGQGHVGFYIGETATEINILSGNDDDQVQIDGHAKSRHTGYWWPKSEPAYGPGSKALKDITATVFDDTTVAYPDVAPGWSSRPGVALPYFFNGARPKVRVTYRGKSVVCDIIDQGPWNFTQKSKGLPGDPYWVNGTRPQAETGTDMTGRKTNKAGIDLTPAAADAIGLPGKGLVDWEFVTEQEQPVPEPTDRNPPPLQTGPVVGDGKIDIGVILYLIQQMMELVNALKNTRAQPPVVVPAAPSPVEKPSVQASVAVGAPIWTAQLAGGLPAPGSGLMGTLLTALPAVAGLFGATGGFGTIVRLVGGAVSLFRNLRQQPKA